MPRPSAGSTDVLMFDWSWSLPVAPSEIMRVRLRRLPTSRLRFVRAPRLTPAASPAHLSAPFSSRAPSHPRQSDAIWRGSWILTRTGAWGLEAREDGLNSAPLARSVAGRTKKCGRYLKYRPPHGCLQAVGSVLCGSDWDHLDPQDSEASSSRVARCSQ